MPTRRGARAPRPRATAPIWSAFPELFIAGYPPEDLVLKPAFQAACRAESRSWRARPPTAARRCWSARRGLEDGKLYNAYCLLDGGAIAAVRFKVDLPNYGVFDEKRVFAPGPLPGPVNFRGVRIGVPICEDIWTSGATTRTWSSAWPKPAPSS